MDSSRTENEQQQRDVGLDVISAQLATVISLLSLLAKQGVEIMSTASSILQSLQAQQAAFDAAMLQLTTAVNGLATSLSTFEATAATGISASDAAPLLADLGAQTTALQNATATLAGASASLTTAAIAAPTGTPAPVPAPLPTPVSS